MKEKNRRLETLSFYDHTGIEKHLAKMAQKGWMIERITNQFWTYRKIEPKKVRFAVIYYPEASVLRGLTEKERLLQDYCETAGWKLVTRWTQMQVYCNDAENPVPLETDAVIQIENINKTAWRTHLRGYWIMFGLMLFLGMLVMLVATGGFVDTGVYLLLFAVVVWCVVELAAYYIWYDKAERMARDEGLLLPTKSRRGFQTAILVVFAALYLYGWITNPTSSYYIFMLLLAGLVFAVFLCRYILKRLQVPDDRAGQIAAIVGVFVTILARRLLF